MQNASSKKETANLIPYFIVFAILFIGALGALTWMFDMWFKENKCAIYPNIWCSDTWTCNKSCGTETEFDKCYETVGPTGLASCIFGPKADGANTCKANATTGTGGVSCECDNSMATQTSNCLAGCASDLGSVAKDALCCCSPGTEGCNITHDQETNCKAKN